MTNSTLHEVFPIHAQSTPVLSEAEEFWEKQYRIMQIWNISKCRYPRKKNLIFQSLLLQLQQDSLRLFLVWFELFLCPQKKNMTESG